MLVTSLVSDYLKTTNNNNNNNTMVQSVDMPVFYHNRITSMADELLSLKWNNHKSTFADVLPVLRDQEVFVDVTLACAGKLYPAHKFVLSTCSEYFREIFTKTPCKHPIVFLKDVSGRDLEALLDFMYRGEVNVPQTHLPSLIRTAEGLQVKGLAVPDEHHLNPTASYVRRTRELSTPRPPPAPSISPSPKRRRHIAKDDAYSHMGAFSMMYANASPQEPNSPYDLSQKSSSSSSASQSDAAVTDRVHSVSPDQPSSHPPQPSSSVPPTAPSSSSFAYKKSSSPDDTRTPSRASDDGPPPRSSRSPPPPSSTPQPGAASSTSSLEPNCKRESGKEGSDPLPGPSGMQIKAFDTGDDEPEETVIKEDITIDDEEEESEWGMVNCGGCSDGGDTANGVESIHPDCIPHHYSEASNSSLPTFDPALNSTIPTVKAYHLQKQTHDSTSTTTRTTAPPDSLTAQTDSARGGFLDSLSSGIPPSSEIDPNNCLQCPLCLKEFKVIGSLKRHYRSHINFKPYICDICGKGFTLNQYLIEHRRTHTGERPYSCHVCGKCFAQTGTLYHHVKNVHQISCSSSDKPTDKNS